MNPYFQQDSMYSVNYQQYNPVYEQNSYPNLNPNLEQGAYVYPAGYPNPSMPVTNYSEYYSSGASPVFSTPPSLYVNAGPVFVPSGSQHYSSNQNMQRTKGQNRRGVDGGYSERGERRGRRGRGRGFNYSDFKHQHGGEQYNESKGNQRVNGDGSSSARDTKDSQLNYNKTDSGRNEEKETKSSEEKPMKKVDSRTEEVNERKGVKKYDGPGRTEQRERHDGAGRQWRGHLDWSQRERGGQNVGFRGRGMRNSRGGRGRGYMQNYQSRFSSRIDTERLDNLGNADHRFAADQKEESEVNSSSIQESGKKSKNGGQIKFKDRVSHGSENSKQNRADEDMNWRHRSKEFVQRKQFSQPVKMSAKDAESQRGLLIEQLSSNSYECMVCCECVRREASVWSCRNCYHVFHLKCVKRWARSPAAAVEGATGWRCPACQNVCDTFPHHYLCFCDKKKDPEFTRFDTPHSCGEVCGKSRPFGCTHPCNILCHPGPCPDCHASITKKCNCGATTQIVKCGQADNIRCTKTCSKTLNCGKHECKEVCHEGPCSPCEDIINQTCFCGRTNRSVVCGTSESFVRNFSCKQPCKRELDCKNHQCDQLCHPGTCESCQLLPAAVTRCPCGQVSLADLRPGDEGQRSSCIDPIPTCGNICGKELACGPEDTHHTCDKPCHEDICGQCQGQTEVTCHCGALSKEVPCVEAATYSASDPFRCDKRCNRKRTCGRHRCGQQCCTEEEHPCDQICGRKLSCGLHRCEEVCHRSNCPTCWHVSFEELHCQCGAEVLFPPIPCGTQPPECKKTCTRSHSCNHPVRHNCHSEENCPPCTFLTEKWCMGRHELRKNIPCHLVDISCGMPCGKPLPCKQHKCLTICHKGECLNEENNTCRQPCVMKRPNCGHPCGAPCHGDEPCPNTPCQTEITVKCKCGNRTGRALCLQGAESREGGQDFQKMATMMMAMKMADVQEGQGIDISGLTSQTGSRGPRMLECTKECALAERNRRLALALDIKNPEQSKQFNPYTQFLKDYAKQNSAFVANIEKAFSELVQKAQMSKQPRRSHAFPPMNREQRRAVHELAEYYGCQTQSYDEEPKKNVVATAQKDKCHMPNVTLTSLTQKDLHKKAPMPIPHGVREKEVRTVAESMKQSTAVLGGSRSGSWASKVQFAAKPPEPVSTSKPTGLSTLSKKKEEPHIDYFDMTS